MGFDVGQHFKVIATQIDDGPYNGFEAKFREQDVGQLLDLTALAGLLDGQLEQVTPEMAGELEAFFGLIGDGLQSWNAELDGDPLPCSIDGVRRLPMGLLLEVADLWMAGGLVEAPLGSSSNGGGPPGEGGIPMAALSAPLPSTSEPDRSSGSVTGST